MSESQLQDLISELDHFDTAMLVTVRAGTELRSRPMAVLGHENDGRIWFITSIDSGKVDELTDNPSVNVAMQNGNRFLSITGTVRVTRDPELLDRVWTESQRMWFEKGRDDPTLVALEIVPSYAEFWDRAGVEGIRFALAGAKAIVQGTTLSGEEAQHAKVKFRRQK
jgi:general stress protein 26